MIILLPKTDIKPGASLNMAKTVETKWKETDLYDPVRLFLEKKGYSVNAEVGECDILAVKNNETVIVELKTRMCLSLVIQGSKRKDLTDQVYLAIPVKGSSGTIPSLSGVLNVLKKLSIGLLFVRYLRSETRVEIILEAREYERRMRRKKAERLHKEIAERTHEYNIGGSRAFGKKMTAYRQQSIRIAAFLLTNGPTRVKTIKANTSIAKTASILQNNFYGWFERIQTGVYGLGETAKQEIQELNTDFPKLFEDS